MAKRKLRPKCEYPSFSESLEAAATERFPGVAIHTDYNIFSMSYITTWRTPDDKKVPVAKARLIREFVAGFEAAWIIKEPQS